MRAPVTHINLLQRTAPAHVVAWSLAAVLALTVVGSAYYGSHLRSQAQEAARLRDDATQQVKDVQARMAVQTGEQARSSQSVALRKELDALQPRVQVAQALIEALRVTEGGRSDEFARALTTMAGVNEPGLWLTGLTVSATGQRLDLRGGASNGASVLRFARRANESLQPLTLRLDSLELQPAAAAGAASAADAGAVAFHLY